MDSWLAELLAGVAFTAAELCKEDGTEAAATVEESEAAVAAAGNAEFVTDLTSLAVVTGSEATTGATRGGKKRALTSLQVIQLHNTKMRNRQQLLAYNLSESPSAPS